MCITRKSRRVHVSGHASQEELKLMIGLTRPRYLVPIHGERRHMVAYAKMAEEMGIKPDNIFICGNGSVLEFTADSDWPPQRRCRRAHYSWMAVQSVKSATWYCATARASPAMG